MRRCRVLVVDDEASVVKYLRAALIGRNYEVTTALDGAAALLTVEKDMPDIVILDKIMPKMDGLQVCARLREWSPIPIIMLSGDCNTEEKIRCFEAGADDYICKPFDVNELIARIGAVLRRYGRAKTTSSKPFLTVGNLVINFAARQVTYAGKEITLTRTEFDLLQELAVNVGKVLRHAELLKKIWGVEYSEETEYLRVFVNRLRAKLEPDPAHPRYILTATGLGYMFNRRTSNEASRLGSVI